jgi:Na+-translocating ferredoxin:NAD+ oxidoreductase RnfE subunit
MKLKTTEAFKIDVCIRASSSLCFMTILSFYTMTLYKSLCTFILDFNCVLYERVLKSNAFYFLMLERNAHRNTN